MRFRIEKDRIRALLMMVMLFASSAAIQCPVGTSTSSSLSTDLGLFPPKTQAFTYGIVPGMISNGLYYLYRIASNEAAVVRKMDSSNSEVWVSALPFTPITKSLSVDINEQSVLYALNDNPTTVVRLNAVSGALISAQSFTILQGDSVDMKTHILNDNSGFLFLAKNTTSSSSNLCKYQFSFPTSSQCQIITAISGLAFGSLKISDSQMFFDGLDASNNLLYYKVTVGSTAVDWANKVTCSSGPCTASKAEAIISSDGTQIYSFATFGSSISLYFVTFRLSDGSVVGNRYKSSTGCNEVDGLAQSGSYICSTAYCGAYVVILFDSVTLTFNIRRFPGMNLYQVTSEPISQRLIIGGCDSNNGLITKFVPQSFMDNPNFVSFTMSMTILASTTDQILPESFVYISTPTSNSVTQPNYSSQAFTTSYSSISSTTSDILYHAGNQMISLFSSKYLEITPNLTCSSSGSTSIAYSIANYNGVNVPSWVQIDTSSGLLKINAPVVSTDTQYSFYVNSVVSGNTIQKIITINVINCVVSNCQSCVLTSGSTCMTCNSGYSLFSGNCILQSSNNLKSSTSSTTEPSSTSVNSVTISAAGIVLLTRALTGSSYSCFWLMVNQLQLLFFLLLTGVYLPSEVIDAIVGMKIYFFSFDVIPFK